MNEIISANGMLAEKAKHRIAQILEIIDELESEKKTLQAQLLEGMELYGVKKIDNDQFTVTYIEPTTRVSIDQKKLKEKFEEVYLECVKESKVKSSIRIKLK